MKEKQVIDLNFRISGADGVYYGSTLTSVLGDSTPDRKSLRTLECVRVSSKPKLKSGRSVTSVSRLTVSSPPADDHFSQDVRLRTISWTSRLSFSRGCSASSSLSMSGTNPATATASSVFSPRSCWQGGRSCSTVGRSSRGFRRYNMASSATGAYSLGADNIGGSSRDEEKMRTSQSFASTSTLPDLKVWILEDFNLQLLTSKDMGFFHQANIYIISKRDTDGATFLHIWHGSLSSKKESTIAREKAGILDLSMDGATFVSLEHEGNETATFLSHFPDGIVIVEGKSKQSLERSTKYAKKLYLVTGRSQPLATCVDCSVSLATPNHVLILDSHPRIYVWVGEHVDYVLKVKAIKLAKKIRDFQRNGKCHIIIIDKSVSELANLFIKKLETFQQSEPSLRTKISENFPESTPQLYRVNGDRVLYDMPLVVTRPLQQKYLTSKDSFILETKPTEPLFIWVGSKSDPDATSEALKCAEAFVSYHNTSPKRAVCRVTEGDEPTSFKKYFSDWKDRLVKKSRVVHHYNISNIERSLFSKNNNHSNGKVTEVSMKDYDLLDGNGDLQIWKVNDEYLVLLPIEQQWVFDNWSCYIILYSESRGGRDINIIFYWVGAKTNREEEVQAQKSALAMDQALGHKNVIVRILDGKETSHFMTALQNNIIVYDVDQQLRENAANYCSNNVTKMYSVKEVTKHSTRISQVPPVSSSLNTNAAFIITSPEVSFLWYGKNASAYEREYSKSMLAYFSPGKTYDYDIFLEGKETAKVWSAVEIDEQPSMDMEKHSLPSCQPKLVLCKKHLGKWKFDYLDNFTQEDLCENVQFILDLQNEVLLWTGISVPDRNHELLSGILNEFVDSDPAGRNMSDLQVWYVNQGYEPQVFKKHFQIWEETNYGGELAYEIARKRLRQENALIDCEVNNKELDHYVKIPYKNLITKDKLPDSIDRNHLELYLSDKDFMQILNMPRTEFYRMPAWKQKQILKSAKLFVSASKTQDNYLTSHNEVKAA